jgi:hypothetical protein
MPRVSIDAAIDNQPRVSHGLINNKSGGAVIAHASQGRTG